jgi:hypothetical protein
VKQERAPAALRPRPVWDSIALPRAFARPARFDFRPYAVTPDQASDE